MWLSLVVFASGLLLTCCAWYRSTYVYVRVFFGFMMFVLVRRVVWCTCIHCIFGNNLFGALQRVMRNQQAQILFLVSYLTQQHSWHAITYCG